MFLLIVNVGHLNSLAINNIYIRFIFDTNQDKHAYTFKQRFIKTSNTPLKNYLGITVF